MTELIDAIKAGDAEAVRAIVTNDPSRAMERAAGVTPLLLALYLGRTDLARLLIELGAPLTFPEACAVGDLERVREWLGQDPAIVNARSEDGFPALGLAIFFRQPLVARELITHGADVNAAAENRQCVTPLHAAVAVCDHESARLLLSAGAAVNARQQMDYTPLHGAASRGDVAMAEMLLEHGADRHAASSDGALPSEVARKYGHPEFAEWLEQRP